MTRPATPSPAAPSLSDLHRDVGGVAGVFSGKADAYAASRPDYPAALYDALEARGFLPPSSDVADLGAGTGLFARALLERGHRVVAVDPSAPMRAVADAALSGFPGYRSIAGTAEHSGLPDASVDLVTAAQAFHWFRVNQARAECLRILRPGGLVALVWNDREPAAPVNGALDSLFLAFGGDKRRAMATAGERREVPAFFRGGEIATLTFAHAHRLDALALEGLAFSRSYMPAPDSEEGRKARTQIADIFAAHAEGGMVTIPYETVAIVGRPHA